MSLPFSKMWLIITTLTCLMSLGAHAQNSPQDFLNAHNAARTQVGVPNMTWDSAVANYAFNYVNSRIGDCNLVHSNGSTYGENLAKGSASSFTGTAAVNLWVAEKPNYDHNSTCCTCVGGQQCLHYTQVVWGSSLRLGCARLQCNNGWWFVSCNYDPPGNYAGQRPY